MQELKTDPTTEPREAPPSGEPPPWEPGPAPRRLYRSRVDRMLGGVAGGLGHYFNVDPVWFRLAFVVLAFSGAGVLAYVVLWIVMPERPLAEAEPPISAPLGSGRGKEVVAWFLVGLGLIVLLSNFNLLPWWGWNLFWPLLMILGGIALLVRQSDARSG